MKTFLVPLGSQLQSSRNEFLVGFIQNVHVRKCVNSTLVNMLQRPATLKKMKVEELGRLHGAPGPRKPLYSWV